jgi:hypothetical protein
MRTLSADDVPTWVEQHLLFPTRALPIVAITSHPRTNGAWVDVEALQRTLGDLAEVVFLETGEPTWALSEALPPRLDVYGGAMRIWWPGLTRESDPHDHRLYFAYSAGEAERAVRRLVADVRERAGLGQPAQVPAPATVSATTTVELPPELVTVTAIVGVSIEVESADRRGLVKDADLPLDLLAASIVKGSTLQARPVRRFDDGTWDFSIVGLLPSLWERLVEDVHVGDVVTGRVQNVSDKQKLVFVDVLPGVVGICHVSELDYGHVERIEDFATPGEIAPFQVLTIGRDDMTLVLSRKRAHGHTPRPLPSLVPGGRAFEWQAGAPFYESLRRRREREPSGRNRVRVLSTPAPSTLAAPARTVLADQVDSLEAELRAANEERANLVEQLRLRQRQLQEARKDQRAAEDQRDALQRRLAGEDALASERAFLLAVRLAYARMLDEGQRHEQPLQRMRVGPDFLASLRDIEGVEIDKVVEVCAQVAAGIAYTIAAREVHQLRAGLRRAPSRSRTDDGAQAWRCALQVNTPSARRLHWWSVPGPDGATIEFASVDVHDSFGIPDGRS